MEDPTNEYLLLFSCFLGASLILSKKLHDFPAVHSCFSEAALVLTIGIIVGGAIRIFSGMGNVYDNEGSVIARTLLGFSPRVFFTGLLPPILFNSGYQLRRELFFRHIRPIVLFAAMGTVISAVATALSLFAVVSLGWTGDFKPSLTELFTFGSLIAATDTVSVISVLQAKKVDPHLFCLVFGESALNDAVALVLYETLSEMLQANAGEGVIRMIQKLFVQFSLCAVGSPVLGIACGFLAALLFKYVDFRESKMIELSLYVLCMYVPYLIAECFQLSGIVVIFFTGMSARRYIVPNLSSETAQGGETIFGAAAYVAEVCIFLEVGLSIWGLEVAFNWGFIAFALAMCLMARACAIYPLAYLWNRSLRAVPEIDTSLFPALSYPAYEVEVNSSVGSGDKDTNDDVVSVSSASTNEHSKNSPGREGRRKRVTPVKRKDKKISPEFAHFLWFAGLRGAIAYACARSFPGDHVNEFVGTTVVIILFTVIIMGGGTQQVLGLLNIKTNVDEEVYMKEWRKRRELRGPIHDFGKFVKV